MSAKRDSGSTAVYMQIRRYVINLITRAGRDSIRLPTIPELSEQFSVSRPTVCKAMKALTDEGLVIGRRGLGSFTNPRTILLKNLAVEDRKPIVGVCFGDGRLVHFNSYHGELLAAVLHHVTKIPAWVHQISLTSTDEDRIYRELKREMLDALIHFSPQENMVNVLRRLNAEGLPVLICGDREDAELSTISADYYGLGRQIGAKLLERNLRNIACLPVVPPWDLEFRGIFDVYREAGAAMNESLLFTDPATALDQLGECIRLGVPVDAICDKHLSGADLIGVLLRMDPSCRQRPLIVDDENVLRVKDCPFPLLVHSMEYESMGELIESEVSGMLAGDRAVHHRICRKRELSFIAASGVAEK